MSYTVGIVGDGTMGTNLAQNFADHDVSCLVLGHHQDRIDKMKAGFSEETLSGTVDLNTFIGQLASPKTILLLVPAGKATDGAIEELSPFLSKGDIILDLGNALYKDTERRTEELNKKGIQFIGCGISGGSEGARYGASMMPGGSKEALEYVLPFLEKVTAKDFSGNPCVTNCGLRGAGHAVKMIHNGIEYAIMDMIASLYAFGRDHLNMTPKALQSFFAELNTGPLQSFLLDLTENILGYIDEETKEPLIDLIVDKAGNKGTGMWTSREALEQGVPVHSIQAAMQSRMTSSFKELRGKLAANKGASAEVSLSIGDFQTIAQDSLLAGIYISFAQGLHLLKTLSREYDWNVPFDEVLRIWQGGCIIRIKVLEDISSMLSTEGETLLESPIMQERLQTHLPALRKLVSMHVQLAQPTGSFGASLEYIDSFYTNPSSANMIQALRDSFGAHTYLRTDKEGIFTTDWTA